ncbi:MAG: DUF4338 domain-containing protein [Verrucomicrobiales bacterium]|nr:DUF4338 domain-containing protein [Verrucomicrobiales bacterium]
MHIEIHPNVEGIAAERLLDFAASLAADETSDSARLPALVEQEAAWARRTPHLNGQTKAYEASMRLLADLRALKWRVRADRFGIELVSPRRARQGKGEADFAAAAKNRLRDELRPVLASQFADRHVRSFIADCEDPPPGKKNRRSIRLLVADGAELAARLEAAARTSPGEPDPLASAIQPYLQLVPGEGESDLRDEFTGLRLGKIWRYFRYTWAIPQTAIPGRQLFYLVRDRAHPCHAVIGIAALGNSPLIATDRDRAIGWTTEEFSKRLLEAAAAKDAAFLGWAHDHLLRLLNDALAEVDPTDLVDPAHFGNPPREVIARLQRRASEFAAERKQTLKDSAEADRAGAPLILQETEVVYGGDAPHGTPPVSLEVLNLEGRTAHEGTGETKARRLLVAKKRAFELARLLKAKAALLAARDALVDPAALAAALLREENRSAISTALLCAKSDRVGTNMLEITTCGAVAPYNHILGGKLVALLLLSPEVADDYRRRYGDRPSIISSQLKNAGRTKDCTLAWLNTTSLYAHGSSQYERLRLPAGTIVPDQPEIRYQKIGDTVGYGTVQFSDATVRAVEAAWEEAHQFSDVNSIFGEGFSPKFRKMRDGMNLLGFNPTVLMRHDQLRRVYAVPLWENASVFLRGESANAPDYIRHPDRFRDATERIAAFWRTRWLRSRLRHAPALEALRSSPFRSVSEIANELAPETAPAPERDAETPAAVAEMPVQPAAVVVGTAEPDPELEFWRDIARAGPDACADELSAEALARLHVPQPLDDFLIEKVREGFSLVLTGNAGDGKTHLLRRLEPELSRIGAVVERDATAAMRPDDIGPVLDAWKQAHAAGKPYCLAANEYPFHLLYRAGKDFPPVAEAARQAAHRLVYGEAESAPAVSGLKVLVVDLSLRNPLHPDFSLALLRKILDQPAIQAAAEAQPDSDLAWNHRLLSEPRVQERLGFLLTRCAAAGQRAPVRELLIWFARMLLGDALDEARPSRSPGRWYASRLLDLDDRFTLSCILRIWADPAAFSHPRWDWLLESGALADGWTADGAPRLMGVNEENFRALKRRFFFEHDHGRECFDLDPAPGADLLRILAAAEEPGENFKRSLIESINRAYCADLFPEMTTRLFLWVGHRFHEQPSRAHIANRSIPETELALRVPRIPSELRGALPYQPDHLLLACQSPEGRPITLIVDGPLRAALARLEAGLPRQLLPDRELFRLERFIEALRGHSAKAESDSYIYSQDRNMAMRLRPDWFGPTPARKKPEFTRRSESLRSNRIENELTGLLEALQLQA